MADPAEAVRDAKFRLRGLAMAPPEPDVPRALVRRHPFVAAGIAIGAGLIVGRLALGGTLLRTAASIGTRVAIAKAAAMLVRLPGRS